MLHVVLHFKLKVRGKSCRNAQIKICKGTVYCIASIHVHSSTKYVLFEKIVINDLGYKNFVVVVRFNYIKFPIYMDFTYSRFYTDFH